MAFTRKDLISNAVARLGRFKNSPNIVKYLQAISHDVNNLQDVALEIIASRDIDNAGTHALDLIGKLVGQPRVVLEADPEVDANFALVEFLLPLSEVPAIDESFNERDITLAGTITNEQSSPYGESAYKFNVGQTIEFSDGAQDVASTLNDDFTFDCWIYFPANKQEFCRPNFFTVRGPSNAGFSLTTQFLDLDRHRIRLFSANGDIGTFEDIVTNRWQHLAMTYDASATQVTLFLNQRQIAQTTLALPFTGLDEITLFGGSGFENIFVSYARLTVGLIRFDGTFYEAPTQASYTEDEDRFLTNEEYRTYLRARAVKNFSSSGYEEIISLLSFIFGGAQILITEGVASYSVSIGKELSAFETRLLTESDLLPKPIGVGVEYVGQFPDGHFGFNGVQGAKGFGTLEDLSQGGTFGQLID